MPQLTNPYAQMSGDAAGRTTGSAVSLIAARMVSAQSKVNIGVSSRVTATAAVKLHGIYKSFKAEFSFNTSQFRPPQNG